MLYELYVCIENVSFILLQTQMEMKRGGSKVEKMTYTIDGSAKLNQHTYTMKKQLY